MHGAKTWFIERAMTRFIEMHDVPPDELISAGLEELSKYQDRS